MAFLPCQQPPIPEAGDAAGSSLREVWPERTYTFHRAPVEPGRAPHWSLSTLLNSTPLLGEEEKGEKAKVLGSNVAVKEF